MSWYSGKWSLVSHDSNFRAFFLVPFSPLSWSMEQAYLDLKEFWVSYWTEKEHNILPTAEKTDDIWRRHQQFLRERRLRNERINSILMTRHYPDLGSASDWLKKNFPRVTTNQKHYPDLGSDASLVWNFCVVVALRIVASYPHSLQKPFNWCF